MNPVKTLCFTLSLVALLAANALAQKTVYFYPPDDAKWISGRSYIHNGTNAVALELDQRSGCGWYKATFNGAVPGYVQFWLGQNGSDRIGPKGRMLVDFDDVPADPNDFFGSSYGDVFELADLFTSKNTSNLYFVADELDPSDPNAGWHVGNQPAGVTDASRCSFKLAAFIYDTDPSLNSSFSDYQQDNGTGKDMYGYWTAGILKGMVKPRLTTPGGKPECDNCTKPGGFKSKDDFDAAFKDYTKGDKNAKNVKLCYDMPFEQQPDGRFQYYSDTDLNHQSKTVGGFFPEVLKNATMRQAAIVSGSSDYIDCPKCANEERAESYVNLSYKVNPYCFERGYVTDTNKYVRYVGGKYSSVPCNTSITACCLEAYGEVIGGKNSDDNNGCGTPKRACGHFAHGDWPSGTWGMTPVNVNANDSSSLWRTDWNDDWRDRTLNLWGDAGCGVVGAAKNKTCKTNTYFCFESHAKFMYDPAQEFFFQGDDDIWVYINNQLVIDLGGAHLAAPGYVKLSEITPALTPGNEYPIDIFFCDRRTSQSNIKVSTNMYIAQKSSFYNDLAKADNTMCAAITTGADCASKMSGGKDGDMCGNLLITNGYQVDFYMINRVTKDTVYLSPARGSQTRYEGCKGDNKAFECNGANGITVNNAIYTCGGKGQCKGNPDAAAKVGITGSYNVYARLMDSQGKQVAGSKPLLIDNFKGESNDRIVWGTLAGQNGTQLGTLKDAYGNTAAQRQEVVVGRRIPVYVSTGSWGDDNFTSFEYDDDPEIAGHGYTLTISGGSGIKIYGDKNATTPIGTNSASRTLKSSGIDTVWVQIDYDVDDRKEFSLNVTGEGSASPSMKIIARQPTLVFDKNGGSGWSNWAVGGLPPYAGSPLDVYLLALDPANGNKVCETCNTSAGFILRDNSGTEGPCQTKLNSGIVSSQGISMVAGEAKIILSGQESTGEPECTARWTVNGLSKDVTTATWTKLRFRDPPVPIPRNSMIFDVNNDGIGDSIYIAFSKPFSGDTLFPVLLQVVWGDTTYFFAPFESNDANKLKDPSFVEGLYSNKSFRDKNKEYWGQYIKANDTIISIGRSKFSKNIRTAGNANDKVSSYIPFLDVENKSKFTYTSNDNSITDRIAPVVVKADYEPGWTKGCENGDGVDANGCREKLTVTLSERVFPRDGISVFDIKNPFHYCLKSQKQANCDNMSDEQRFDLGYDNLGWKWEAPQAANAQDTSYLASYKPGSYGDDNMNNTGSGGGDSTITLIYYHGKTDNSGGTTHKPKAGDWVKIRLPENGANIFVDAEGNPANWYGKERGVAIGGRNNPTREQVKIAAVNPLNKDPLGGIFKTGNAPEWWSEEAKEAGKNLFQETIVSEILPVINPDPIEVKRDYPGSVGAIFNMGSTFNDMQTFLNNDPGRSLPDGVNSLAEAITIHASAYYHTNLGDYTAHQENIVAQCSSQIFNGDCTNNYKFYVAWDLMTNSRPPRFVGAGAYVGISKFHVQLRYKDAGGEHTQTFGKQEFIEMYGVKRAKINNSKPEQPSEPPPVEGSLFGFKRSR